MKVYFFVLFVILALNEKGVCQVPQPLSLENAMVLSVQANLAFGPGTTPTWDPSIGFRIPVAPHFRLGIGDVSFGTADLLSGTRYAIMAGPVVEYFASLAKELTYSILIGIPLQNRWGAKIAHSFGAAPYAQGSFDYHFEPEFALGANIRFQYIATGAYLRSPRVLPTSFVAAGGLEFNYFF